MVENKPRILVVDDEPINIKVLNAMLKEKYQIYVALNGQQALKRVNTSPRPDMVLLDIKMRGMDGYEVCEKLKSDPETEKIPVIFITSMSDEEDEKKGLELGAVDYITKPFRPDIVMARIENHIKLKHYQDLLEFESHRDGLTGVPNRRRFDELFRREWRRGLQAHSFLSLVMLDIDHFKLFNDHYGHMAGDECLRTVARALQTSLSRPTDFVGRYGGEEFICILPDTNLDRALEEAEKMRTSICDLIIPHSYSNAAQYVTLSLGVATTVPNKADSPNRLIELADRMLYKAKAGGRNCVKSKEMP